MGVEGGSGGGGGGARGKTGGEHEHSETEVNIDRVGGSVDDDLAEYQTDGTEYDGSGDGERMQLNPSSDFYDDDDDDDGDYYVDGDRNVNGDEDEENVNVEQPEELPEAKSLVQIPSPSGSSSNSGVGGGGVGGSSGQSDRMMAQQDEEEDMGYDEDDERYAAAAMERPKPERDFMNEEGSGGGGGGGGAGGYGHRRAGNSGYKGYKSNYNDHRLGLTYLDKHKKLPSSAGLSGRDEVVARESSGNFANDDEDDDDEDDDDDGIDDGDGFFNSKRTSGAGGGGGGSSSSGGSRYFRKNTNDAIKIISTPLGKVGIVYQQTPEDNVPASTANNNKKPASTFTDFDALSPDPDSNRGRLASSHPKITPVLTADGKVALLYRGDSESSKYEPIRNVTHKFTSSADGDGGIGGVGGGGGSAGVSGIGSSGGIGGTDGGQKAKGGAADAKANDNSNGDDEQDSSDSGSVGEGDDDEASVVGGAAEIGGGSEGGKQQATATGTVGGVGGKPGMAVFSPVVPTGGPFILRHPTDSVLPMINRPLSEVLGIKKNQFTQIRIRDGAAAAAASTTSTEANVVAMPPRTLATGGQSPDSSSTLHFLTNKVNLADYPTSARTRNFDFDFSRDNTMLDERTRQRSQQEQQQQQQQNQQGQNTEQNTVANEELLSKTEVVNLAIIPHFDEELERLQRLREHETRRHHRQRHHRHKQSPSEEDLSGIHCIMQAMMGIAAISTVFGMLGTFFKQRILDQLRLLHW